MFASFALILKLISANFAFATVQSNGGVALVRPARNTPQRSDYNGLQQNRIDAFAYEMKFLKEKVKNEF